MGHSMDPDKELQMLEQTISGMENTLADLIVKAKKCKYVSSIDYVTEGDRKGQLCMIVETLPDDGQLGKKDGDKFVYSSNPSFFEVPLPPDGKSLIKITCSQIEDGNKFSLTETYDDGDTKTFDITVPGNKGPACEQEATDGKDKEYNDNTCDNTDGNYTIYDSEKRVIASYTTAGISTSATGLSASATGMNVGVTGVTVTGCVTSTSLTGTFVCCQATGTTGTGGELDVAGKKAVVLGAAMSLGPVGALVGLVSSACGAFKKPTKAFKTSGSFKVNN